MILPQLRPRPWQYPFFEAVNRNVDNILITWPRRHGKDVSFLSGVVMRAMQRVGVYFYMFPTRAWAERAIWNNVVTIGGRSGRLLDILIPPEIVLKKNVKDVSITLRNGSIINFGGTDNLDFVGQGGYLYALSEFSLHRPEVTEFIQPILTEGNAALWMNGTLRGEENKLWKLMDANKENDNWFVEHLRPSDTKMYYWIGEGICINPELEGQVSPYSGKVYVNIQDLVTSGTISMAYALQEFMNEAVNTTGSAFYAYEMKKLRDGGRYKEGLYDPHSPVYTFWDLGGVRETSDETVIGFYQKRGDFGVWIDYYERRGGMIREHLDVVLSKPYKYGGHYMPHDARRKDVQSGMNIPEYLRREFKIEVRTLAKTQYRKEDIEITRRAIMRWMIDSETCKRLTWCLENYERNQKTDAPLHNEASHGADMARYGAVADHLKLIEPYLLGEKRDRLWGVQDDYCIG